MCSEMSSTPAAIQVDKLSKSFRMYNHPRDRLLQALWGRDRHGQPKLFYKEFWALQQLSFRLARGQTLGVVGRNGSGKSTLLQLICGTLQPSSGSVQVHGRVGALLELGSGFNPEFSGLENIYLNAAVLGLSKAETEQKLDQILAFADIGAFVHQPVKTYSSGMAVRLAFAVQAHIDPDVLVVDEALAVGDELFQKKCYAHLERLKENGTAVLLVTHSCPQIIQHCDQALLLHKGKARMLDEPARVTITYQRLINASDADWDAAFVEPLPQQDETAAIASLAPASSHESAKQQPISSSSQAWLDPNLVPQSSEIYPSHGARITDLWIERAGPAGNPGDQVNVLPFGEPFVLVFGYEADLDLERLGLACHIASHTGQRISGQTLPTELSTKASQGLISVRAGDRWQVRFSFNGGLWPGVYFAGGGIICFGEQGKSFVHRVVDFRALRILENTPISVVGSCALQANPPQLTLNQA